MPKKERHLQAFLDDAALLLQACPATTRLTLKYKVPKQPEGATNPATATLVAKAYDPVLGVCIKYNTNRAVEVGRLMLGFQELGQLMQNVPSVENEGLAGDEESKTEAMAIDEPSNTAQGKPELASKLEAVSQPSGSQPGGGKKKKKGKR